MKYFINQKGSYSELFKNPDKLEKLIIQNLNKTKDNYPVDNIILIGNSGSGKSMFLRNLQI